MEIITKKVDELTPYEKNPRKNDEAVDYVANSINEFSFKDNICVKSKLSDKKLSELYDIAGGAIYQIRHNKTYREVI